MTVVRRHELTDLLVVVCGLFSVNALGHHGQVSNSALYLTDDFIELDGEITEIFWRNPHVRGRMVVVGDSGEETVWELEFGPTPRDFERRGVLADDLLGPVKTAGYRSKRDPDSLGALHVLLPSGQEWVQGNRELLWSDTATSSEAEELDPVKVVAAERAADGIYRVWGRYRGREFLGVRQPELVTLLTPRGRELATGFDPAAEAPELDCRTGMPRTMMRISPMQIVNEVDRIIIRRETYDVERTVYMNAESSPQPLASPFGFSVGHWEEDALVVHTTHVNWPYMGGPSGGGAPQSEQASYRETFALSSEEDDVLNYEIIVTDPIMFTEPFIHRSDWRWTPGVELESYECVADWEESTR